MRAALPLCFTIACAPARAPEPAEPAPASACEPADDVSTKPSTARPLPQRPQPVPRPGLGAVPESSRPCQVVRKTTDRVIFERLTCYSGAYAVTRDGETVGGQLNGPVTAFRWAGDQVTELGPGRLRALADDGTTAVGLLDEAPGLSHGAAPGVWRPENRDGDPLEQLVGQGRSITPDGRFAAGFAWRIGGRAITALRWDLTDGSHLDLGSVAAAIGPHGENVQGDGISDDGMVIVGTARSKTGRVAFVWRDGRMHTLPALAQANFATASRCNADCSIIGGLSLGPSGHHEAVRWIEGRPELLFDRPEGTSSSNVWAMDATGHIIGGEVFSTVRGRLTSNAYLWDAQRGFRYLADIVAERGLDLGDWRFWSITAMSADGKVVVGRGNLGDAKRWNAYRVVLR